MYTKFIWLSITTFVATGLLIYKKWNEKDDLLCQLNNFIKRDSNNFAYADTLPDDFIDASVLPIKKTNY